MKERRIPSVISLASLLHRLEQLDVDPGELVLSRNEYRILVARAAEIAEGDDGESEDD
jgi:hypothetical protein